MFEIKVDEIVRQRVMKAALTTFGGPLDRARLNEAIKECFRRIPSEHQKTICEVFGWEGKEADHLRYDETALLAEFAQFDDHRLAQFLMPCSLAHYGANQYRNNQVSQSAVVRLSEECGVNHTLMDTEVRASCARRNTRTHIWPIWQP